MVFVIIKAVFANNNFAFLAFKQFVYLVYVAKLRSNIANFAFGVSTIIIIQKEIFICRVKFIKSFNAGIKIEVLKLLFSLLLLLVFKFKFILSLFFSWIISQKLSM